MNRNIKWQVLNKIKKEGWIPRSGSNKNGYMFYSPDMTLYMDFLCKQTSVRYFKKSPLAQYNYGYYSFICQCSYKKFLQSDSISIMAEALL